METIKAILSNGKYRALIFLGFYLLFFSFSFMSLGKKNTEIIIPSKLPTIEIKLNYEYEYILEEKIINIIRSNDVVNFKLDDVDYYYINSECYKLVDEKFYKIDNPLKYNFDFLNTLDDLKDLSTLIKTSDMNGITKKEYEVNLSQFMNLYGEKLEDIKEMLNYSLLYESEKLTKITFSTLNFEINYLNTENIEEININYEFYKEEI